MKSSLEKLQGVSMQIILAAGDARESIQKALKNIENFNFQEAEKDLVKAKENLGKAHSTQTETIQGEARGEKTPFSSLFTHAQDHLMTTMSEFNIANNLLDISKTLDRRIAKLEEKLK